MSLQKYRAQPYEKKSFVTKRLSEIDMFLRVHTVDWIRLDLFNVLYSSYRYKL